jgi:hypothetical protein
MPDSYVIPAGGVSQGGHRRTVIPRRDAGLDTTRQSVLRVARRLTQRGSGRVVGASLQLLGNSCSLDRRRLVREPAFRVPEVVGLLHAQPQTGR